MNEKDIELLYNRQKEYFNSGITRNVNFRIEQLKRLYNIIDHNTEEIIHSLGLDLNKGRTESFTSEILYVQTEIRGLIKKIRKWSRSVKVRTPLVNKPGKSYYRHEPYGSVLIISPWNYPFGLIFSPLVGAVASGNCVIAKPSELTPNTSKCINKIISENFEEKYIKIAEGDARLTQSLIRKETGYIFFTGGTSIGKIIMESASKYLIPVTLELGGKNPCIVDENINLNTAARRIVWGKFFNAGQTCIAPDYLMVHRNIKDSFLSALLNTIKEFYETDDPVRDFTRIINRKHYERLCSIMKEGNIIKGGITKDDALYISPTIMNNIDFDSVIMQEEIFGPVLPVLVYEDLDSILNRITERDKPLVTYLFSRDKKKHQMVIDRSRSGSVCINGTIHLFLSNELPFGGVGASGMGRYHGFWSFDTFAYKKAVLKKVFWGDMKAFYPPYRIPLKVLKRILKFL